MLRMYPDVLMGRDEQPVNNLLQSEAELILIIKSEEDR